jgi:tRNA-dihydrouridine synthase
MTLYLAPLHGVTNRIYRKVWFKHFSGIDVAFAPFIPSVPGDRMTEKHFKDLVGDPEIGVPLVPQILGNDAPSFIATAKVLAGFGYGEVNWNLGCPFSMVAKKGRGSGLLPHADRIARFLDEVCPHLEIPLSVKVRLGREDRDEILRLMPILNGHALKEVIIHPRLGIQMYKGQVDLEGFERAASLCAHRVVYNGDIVDLATFETLQGRFPRVEDWMIGRGALSDPFLPGAIVGRSPVADPLGAIGAFHDELYAAYRSVLHGSAHVLDKMKEVWTYLGSSISGVPSALGAISRAKTLVGYEALVRSILAGGTWEGSR